MYCSQPPGGDRDTFWLPSLRTFTANLVNLYMNATKMFGLCAFASEIRFQGSWGLDGSFHTETNGHGEALQKPNHAALFSVC